MSIKEDDLKDPTYWLRWSINSGLATEVVKDTLYSYAYLCHKDVKAAEVAIDIENKRISYKLYLPKKTVVAYHKYHELVASAGIIDLWRAKRIIKKYGNLEIKRVLTDFVSKLCGAEWAVSMSMRHEEDFVEDRGEDEA